jgi:hypothetical protein
MRLIVAGRLDEPVFAFAHGAQYLRGMSALREQPLPETPPLLRARSGLPA